MRRLICACFARLYVVGDSLPLYSRVASLQTFLGSKARLDLDSSHTVILLPTFVDPFVITSPNICAVMHSLRVPLQERTEGYRKECVSHEAVPRSQRHAALCMCKARGLSSFCAGAGGACSEGAPGGSPGRAAGARSSCQRPRTLSRIQRSGIPGPCCQARHSVRPGYQPTQIILYETLGFRGKGPGLLCRQEHGCNSCSMVLIADISHPWWLHAGGCGMLLTCAGVWRHMQAV